MLPKMFVATLGFSWLLCVSVSAHNLTTTSKPLPSSSAQASSGTQDVSSVKPPTTRPTTLSSTSKPEPPLTRTSLITQTSWVTQTSTEIKSVSSVISSVISSSTSTALPFPISLPLASTPGEKSPKRGIAFAAGDTPDDIFNGNQTKSAVTWVYDWGGLPPAYLATSNMKYIPMQWGSGNIENLVEAIKAQGADTVLVFNEPDFANEANIRPGDAAALWMEFIQPLKQQGVRLGGPAVTAAPTGQSWLRDFFNACSNCTIDFLPLHWYGEGIEGFYSYIWSTHGAFPQYPIWITEYADTSNNDTAVWDFMNQTTHYLDALEWVERYAWFGFFRSKPDVHYNMLTEQGGFNALGELYFGAQTVHTSNRSTTGAYTTVSPSDDPNRPLVTSWPSSAINTPCEVTLIVMSSIFVSAMLVTIL